MAKGRVLVVEDNQDNLVLIEDVLNSLQYDFIAAQDGIEAIETARAHHPDLILMDMSLPRMDGWTATRHLKADAELAPIPVIALTAHAMAGDREKALAAGCDDYLSKPINMRDLAAKLRQFIPAPDTAT